MLGWIWLSPLEFPDVLSGAVDELRKFGQFIRREMIAVGQLDHAFSWGFRNVVPRSVTLLTL